MSVGRTFCSMRLADGAHDLHSWYIDPSRQRKGDQCY